MACSETVPWPQCRARSTMRRIPYSPRVDTWKAVGGKEFPSTSLGIVGARSPNEKAEIGFLTAAPAEARSRLRRRGGPTSSGPTARGPPLRGRRHRQLADLREERHEVEVMLRSADLVAFEGHHLDGRELHTLVGRRNRSHLRGQLAAVRPFPGDLEDHGVRPLDDPGDRALRVGKRLPPALAELDDRVRALDPPLR